MTAAGTLSGKMPATWVENSNFLNLHFSYPGSVVIFPKTLQVVKDETKDRKIPGDI